MNIQANLTGVSLIPNPKKAANKPTGTSEDLNEKHIASQEKNNPLTTKNIERAEIIQKIETLNDSQKANIHIDNLDYKNQKSIQSYLDHQALESQTLRDELHSQLGVDFSV